MASPSLLARKGTPGRQYIQLDVTRLVSGANLRLGLHVVTGEKAGPTLGILTTIHGDETMALMAVRELLNSIDVGSLAGRVAAIPVANPLAVAVFQRQTRRSGASISADKLKMPMLERPWLVCARSWQC